MTKYSESQERQDAEILGSSRSEDRVLLALIASPGKRINFFEQSYVYFNELSDEEMRYISSGGYGKAGAYGIGAEAAFC